MKLFPKDGIIHPSSSADSPHNIIPSLIPPHSSVLDIGCNSGILGKKIRNKSCLIDGIDINQKALKIAQKYYHRLFIKNLSKKLELNSKYDYIVLSDILEHLPNPDKLLNNCHSLLNKNGKLIISLPNIARLEIRLKLLFGKFDYSPGILSPDHLRFFTYSSAKKLLNHCHYNVTHIIPTGLGHKIKILPNLTAFQFIYICESK